jgi:hypothetical protein
MYEDDNPIIINTQYYPVVKCKQYIQIGCKKYTPEEWAAFTDEEIDKMDFYHALYFWKQYKHIILA